MYAMQYGTVPMVRSTGGLKDTVTDMGEWQGWGIRFNHASIGDIVHAVSRAVGLFYDDKISLSKMRKHMMQIDNSWENAVQQYLNIYQSLKI
jgi:starch synthase